jgi:hypothetical protein
MSNPPYDRRASPLEPTSPRVCAGLRSPSPEMMSPAERLEEAASLLARGILRRRLRAADGRKEPLDVLRQPRDECVEWLARIIHTTLQERASYVECVRA